MRSSGKSARRSRLKARQAGRWALFAAAYYRRHGTLPAEMTKSERIKFRNRVLADFARSRA